jgi:type IV pilus assembly protein PilM
MAQANAVWGIDIGHCALKALRCEYDHENHVLVATAFDYVEYPKILSQPDADPEELIAEALRQFMERNTIRGDRIAISVPGQNGLARFFQPPPVDAKKLPDIVRFEARQQIPFPLDEVIWDYQQMGGGNEVDGFVMETEIGLFAMKREQVYEAIEPFLRLDVELDIVQLAPLCVYNFVAHNLLTDSLKKGEYDPEHPPESFVILSVGTDTTDLVITNGYRVWQRNIPLGGNHFTKQLTKELKLTFAKAEHLKRNVREADDAKAVVQAMRPVFNDLLLEVQRSIGFFQNIDRKAEIAGLIMLGNAMKLPGLQPYLSKNLGYELVNVDHERWAARLAGQAVLTSPQFKDNMLAFGVCYGLCLQGLMQSRLSTNLLPRELLRERMIRAKKPWAVAAAACLMLAFATNFFFEYREWYKVHPENETAGVSWTSAKKLVEDVQRKSSDSEKADSTKVDRLKKLTALGKELSGNADRRLLWLELMKAINQALPVDDEAAAGAGPDAKPKPISQRKDLHIEYIETQYFSDLGKGWFTEEVKRKYLEELARSQGKPVPAAANPPDGAAPATPDAAAPAPGSPGTSAPAPGTKPPATSPSAPGAAAAPTAPAAPGAPAAPAAPGVPAAAGAPTAPDTPAGPAAEVKGPEGAGWVIEIKGYHYFNENPATWGGTHVRNTLLKRLRENTVELPAGPGKPPEKFTMEELGVGYAILAVETRIDQTHKLLNPFYEGPAGAPGMPAMTPGMGPGPEGTPLQPGAPGRKPVEDPSNPRFLAAPKYSFTVQFCWQEKPASERLQKREAARKAAAAAAAPANSVAAAPSGG